MALKGAPGGGKARQAPPSARRTPPLPTGCTRAPAGGLRPSSPSPPPPPFSFKLSSRGALRMRGRAAGAGPAAPRAGFGPALRGPALRGTALRGTARRPLTPTPVTRCSGFEDQVGTLLRTDPGGCGGSVSPRPGPGGEGGTTAFPASRLQVSRQPQELWPWPGRSSAARCGLLVRSACRLPVVGPGAA